MVDMCNDGKVTYLLLHVLPVEVIQLKMRDSIENACAYKSILICGRVFAACFGKNLLQTLFVQEILAYFHATKGQHGYPGSIQRRQFSVSVYVHFVDIKRVMAFPWG